MGLSEDLFENGRNCAAQFVCLWEWPRKIKTDKGKGRKSQRSQERMGSRRRWKREPQGRTGRTDSLKRFPGSITTLMSPLNMNPRLGESREKWSSRATSTFLFHV